MIKNPVLSIAGFDNSGGAGLQADLKVFTSFGSYGMTVVTAIAVQNTTGVKGCYMIPSNVIKEQLESIFEDIQPKAIKIGMLFNEEIINTVHDFLTKNNVQVPIVIDPVMLAKSGDQLLLSEARECLIKKLIPLATIVTPNLPEAIELTGMTVEEARNMSQESLAKKILSLGCESVLVKGGHYSGEFSKDIFLKRGSDTITLNAKRIDTKNTHGTGCTLSAAIAALLSEGYSLEDSVKNAKIYLSKALESAALGSVGKGAGPVDHTWFLDECCAGKLL